MILMIMKILIQISFLICILSCNKNETIDITDQCVFPNFFTNQCFWGSPGREYDEIVFVSNEEFNLFANAIRIYLLNLNCDTAVIPNIDFDTFSLLGKYTSGGGCEVEYVRKVYNNINDKTIIYEIDVEYIGGCAMLITNRNWVLIPKLSNNYIVEFVVHEH